MSDTKKERAMTPRMFLHRSKGQVSADSFLAAHRTFLETGELASLTSPVLAKVDSKAIMPTPALIEIRDIVFSHMLNKETREAEEKQARQGESTARVKPWIASIYDAHGEIAIAKNEKGELVELQESFDLAARADGWVDRRLFDGSPDWHGTVSHSTILIKGEPMTSVVTRSDAIARIMKHSKGAVMKVTSKTTTRLGFGVKCGNDRAVFSRG